ncbi:glycosyl transferase [Methylomonas koyamae]|nr:glycosyl transferase [Methylomonas koyamae]
MVKKQTVSIVVPTFKRLDILKKCIKGIYDMEIVPEEVVVVHRPEDDPETATWLNNFAKLEYPNLKPVSVFVTGQVAAQNAGLAVASSDFIAFLDDDAVPKVDWLVRLLRHFDAKNVGAAGGRDLLHDGGVLPQNEVDKAAYFNYWGIVIGNHHRVVGEPRDVVVVKGCNWIVRRSAIGSLHFDVRLKGKGAQVANELWFCLNLRHHGWRIVLDPKAMVDHFPAIQHDHGRGNWGRLKCYENAFNVTAVELAYASNMTKLKYIFYHFFVGQRYCPGLYFICHSLAKRPSSLPGMLLGGWSGFFDGLRMASNFKLEPPGLPAKVL